MGIVTFDLTGLLPTNHIITKAEEGLPTSDFRLPTSVAMKGGDRPTRLLPYAKILLVPKTFFFPSAG